MPNPIVIDLSHHNAHVDFQRVRATGIVGVIHKATQGVGFIDSKYRVRKQAALAAGLLWGAYHFGTGEDVDEQVNHFLDVTQPDGSFVLVLDFEKNEPSPGNSISSPQAKHFLAVTEQRAGQRPTIYTGSYMNSTVGGHPDPDLARYRVWWARYTDVPHLHPTWQSYWLWQYTDGHHGPEQREVDGVGSCDCNTFVGTEAELRANWVA
jgi:lysozyme